MNGHLDTDGVVNLGTMTVHGSAFGYKPVLNADHQSADQQRESPDRAEPWDVGVITILSEETQAVILALGLEEFKVGGLRFYQAPDGISGSPHKVAAIRALGPGQRSTAAACAAMRERYNPKTIVLTGIGGAIRPWLRPGDVVVATEVVYYDLRKETPSGIQHRGEARQAPAETGHAVNAFFTDHDPADFAVEDPSGTTRAMRMRPGLIGSGEAVFASHGAETLAYLAAFNDKILAIDTEAGALAQTCHEQSAATGQVHGWAVVRGISDDAGPDKNDDYHHLASWHAAAALRKLIPYLPTATATPPRRLPGQGCWLLTEMTSPVR